MGEKLVFVDGPCPECSGDGCASCNGNGTRGFLKGEQEGTADLQTAWSRDNQLRCWREDRKLSMKEMARACGLTVVEISDIERGRMIPDREQNERLISFILKTANDTATMV